MKHKKKLYLLSPSDRFNYGDMLFPYILIHYLGHTVDEVVNCATVRSDLSDKGGMPTLGYEELFKADTSDDNFLVVAGGESLFSPWFNILSYIYPDVDVKVGRLRSLPHVPLLRRVYTSYLNMLIRKQYLIKTSYPFVPGLDELPNFKAVLYNSVGCVNLSNYKRIEKNKLFKHLLSSAAYLAVRDNGTCRGLEKMGIKHSLYPDSAILMSEVFSNDFLIKNKSVSRIPFGKGGYVFFQINTLSAKGNEAFFAEIITDIYKRTGIHFVLCPIGTALGHCDDEALQAISSYLPNDCYFYIDSPNIWDIMYLIKNSILYVGTSLHGAITAQSFSIPMVTHGKMKLKQYLTDWGGIFTIPNSLEKDIIRQLTHPVIPSCTKQKELAMESMHNMATIIENF